LSTHYHELKKERFSFGDFFLLAATLGTTQGLLGIFEFFYREKRKTQTKTDSGRLYLIFSFLSINLCNYSLIFMKGFDFTTPN